ncbi:MAG: hypothetical protein JXX29_19365 [Deltaproteobacteria bacterium]|nr:hypothetical protein [Deltaproteobacteria bacterium]MBN2673848.1 hypothetical protein [Deltaproteobacteria bacterium]
MTWMKISAAIAGCTFISLVAVQWVRAQSTDEWRKATENNQPKLELSQNYHGTKPGDGNTLPKVEELKGKDGLWITWPGFFMTADGGSRIFIQTTAPLEYKQKTSKKKIVLTFKDTKVHLSNNQNPLVTLHFNTPLRKAYLKKYKKKTELILELKTKTTPAISQSTDADGYSYLFIDFPPGQYPQGGTYGKQNRSDAANNEIELEDSPGYEIPE